jgi:CRP-like cAMP-binding protein
VPFLSNVPAHKIEYLCPMFRYRPIRAGETLFEKGSLGSTMYVILDGRVQAKMDNDDKDSKENKEVHANYDLLDSPDAAS